MQLIINGNTIEVYSVEHVEKLQSDYGSGFPLGDEVLSEEYILISVPVRLLRTYDGFIPTVHNWLDYRCDYTVNGKPYADISGIRTIESLIQRYLEKLEVYPLVVTRDFKTIDGYHRLAALNTLGIDSVYVYYPY